MRIKMLTTAAGPSGTWPAGSVQVVEDGLGKALIEGGYAEPVAEDAPAPAQVIVHEATDSKTEARETATAPAQRKRRTSKAKGKA